MRLGKATSRISFWIILRKFIQSAWLCQVIRDQQNFINESLHSFNEMISNEDWKIVYDMNKVDTTYKEFSGTEKSYGLCLAQEQEM